MLSMVNLAVAATTNEEAMDQANQMLEDLTAGPNQDPYYLDPNAQPDMAALRGAGLVTTHVTGEDKDASKEDLAAAVE